MTISVVIEINILEVIVAIVSVLEPPIIKCAFGDPR